MQSLWVYVYLLSLASVQMMLSFEILNNNADPLDDVQQSLSMPYDSSLSLDSSTPGKLESHGNCLLHHSFADTINRNRRASISRPYFQHWRGARDNRLTPKNLLAFSPRLGKRASDMEPSSDVVCNDFPAFVIGYLQGKNMEITYRDSSKICLSQAVSDDFLQTLLDKYNASLSPKITEEMQERQMRSEHPVWLRYRLG